MDLKVRQIPMTLSQKWETQTGTLIHSIGHAFKDVASGTRAFFQKFLGSSSGTILWTVILLIIVHLLY